MKRNLVQRLLALLLVFCVVAPQSAMAASTTYCVEVSIEEEENSSKKVTSKSAGYLLESEKLIPLLVAAINERYADGSLEETFASPAMKKIMDEGLAAYEDGEEAWAEYEAKYAQKVSNVDESLDLKSLLMEFDSTIGALTVDKAYQIKFKNDVAGDAKVDTTYIVTVTRMEYSAGGGGGGGAVEDDTYSIDLKGDKDKGTLSSDKTEAEAGDTITITAKAKDGYRLRGLTTTDEDGKVIAMTDKGNGVYTFVMPESNVTVKAQFVLAVEDPDVTDVSKYLNTDTHVAFMVGDDKGNFRPNDPVTRAEVAQIFYALLRNKSVTINVRFEDVPADAWYADAVNTLASLGRVSGVGNNCYDPSRAITRAEFAAIAAQFANKTQHGFDFTDVAKDHWSYSGISTAAAYGWISGVGNNQFAPNRSITRAEVATIVNHMLGRLSAPEQIDDGAGKRFPDVSESHWGWYEIVEATTEHKFKFNDDRTEEIWVQ